MFGKFYPTHNSSAMTFKLLLNFISHTCWCVSLVLGFCMSTNVTSFTVGKIHIHKLCFLEILHIHSMISVDAVNRHQVFSNLYMFSIWTPSFTVTVNFWLLLSTTLAVSALNYPNLLSSGSRTKNDREVDVR